MDLSEITTMLGTIVGIVTPILGAGAWKYRKQNKKLKDTEVALSEANVEKAKMESKSDEWHIWKEQLEAEREHVRFKDERISELLKLNADKETRFQESEKDKTAQMRKYVAENMQLSGKLIEAQKEIADLKVELEKKRCDDLPCPFRRPPNAHTTPQNGLSIEEYQAKRSLDLSKS